MKIVFIYVYMKLWSPINTQVVAYVVIKTLWVLAIPLTICFELLF